MSFLLFHSAAVRCLRSKPISACYSVQQTAHNGSLSLKADQDSFEGAGIQPEVAASLRNAFPNVQKPTAMQRKLIRAITKNRDVLLQDDTGTGKSFATMLALLNKFPARKASSLVGEIEDRAGQTLAALLIVPHRDLAYQYLHWIHHMTLPQEVIPSSLTRYAQVLVRHVDKSTLRGLPIGMQEAIRSASSDQDQLIHKPPHILIATPNAVLGLIERHPEVFRLAMPSTIVVDEVDALLRVPGKPPKERRKTSRFQKKPERHIPDLAQMLDKIYPVSKDKQRDHLYSRSARNKSLVQSRADPAYRPQLIMISATLRNRLQRALFDTFGWIQRGEVLKFIRKRSSALPAHRLSRSAVHHVLVVSKTGDIKNVAGARPLQPDTNCSATLLEEEATDDDGDENSVFYDDGDDVELVDGADRELSHAPLAFDPAMLEAVAAIFALEVPRIALLVLPASAAVRKIIFELRQLGVDAHPFDLVANDASRTHVLSQMDEALDENPALIVATLATVRGIDLPDLTHVFMLGVLEGRSGDAYLHVAGRVGRFGRRGKVITILEERTEDRMGNKVVVTDDPKKMAVVLSRLGIQPTRLAHFD